MIGLNTLNQKFYEWKINHVEGKMNEAFLSLGSNIAPAYNRVLGAIDCLKENNIEVLQQSRAYMSEPWGMESNAWFINMCLHIRTCFSAHQLLVKLKEIEKALGRVQASNSTAYQSREIDIDIIYFNNLEINTEILCIPHPKLHLRKFVLLPLNEIAPTLVHPTFKLNTKQLLLRCGDVLETILVKSESS